MRAIMGMLLCLFLLTCSVGAFAQDAQQALVPVNIQIDAEEGDLTGLLNITDELARRGITQATVFATGKFANENSRVLTGLSDKGFEIASHGYSTGEQLATMTYADQYDVLSRGIQAVRGCVPCGFGRTVVSFRPQYFSQNEDTLSILAKLEIRNTSGFKAKITYSEGHEGDMGPYEIEKYGLVAVPITTAEFKGERVYLCDIGTALGKKLPAESWKEILFATFDECRSAGCPLVFIVHGWFTGDREKNKDCWDVFEAFLNHLQENGARFVTTDSLAR